MRALIFLLAAGIATAASTPLQLGVDYSEGLDFSALATVQLATDNAGAAYFLATSVQNNTSSSTITKLSPDGSTILWRNALGFAAGAMAVDPNGGVYVITIRQQSDTTIDVAKLSPTGTGLAWRMPLDFLPQSVPAIAADAQGRVYLAAQYETVNFTIRNAYVLRLNAAGTALDFNTQITGTPNAIAIDPSGAAYIAGTAVSAAGVSTGFLTKVGADGTPGYSSTFAAGLTDKVAVDGAGNVLTYGGGNIQYIDSNGAVIVKTSLPGAAIDFAVDAAGNAYVTAVSNQLYPMKNSLAICRFDAAVPTNNYAQLLNVIAPDGTISQSTYLPGGDALGAPRLAVTPSGRVLVVATAGARFSPTQTGPFKAGGLVLFNLTASPAKLSVTYPLACAGNAASFFSGAVAPGELVTLFGSGLGPLQGVALDAGSSGRYPTLAANTQVTFDGTPAPLLWVQDTQINLVAPMSLAPGKNTQVCVTYNNTNTNCLTLPVATTSPAVFTVDGRYAAAVNQDGTINSAVHPASPGSIVAVFATGLGPIAPAQPDGTLIGQPLPANIMTFAVEASYTIGIPFGIEMDVPFEVQYAGPAPGMVAGVSQLNFQVKPFASYGAIYLHIGSSNFSPGFTIYVAGQ